MKILRILSYFLATFCALSAVTGCGGGGGGGGSSSNPFAGSYIASFTRSTDSKLLVAVWPNGTAEAVVSDDTGVVVEGTGVADPATGAITLNMDGPGGPTTMTGLFSRSPGLDASLTGGVQGSNLQAGKTNSGNSSVFAGKYTVQYGGSSSGELDITIANDGKVYKRVGTQLTRIGSITPGGKITFSGEGLVTPPTHETEWSGTIFLTPGSVGGSGEWKDPSDGSFQGNWSAVPDGSGGEPVFHRVDLVKGLGADYPSILAASQNGHLAGFVGSNAAYWDSPTADPILLNNAPGANISWATDVNANGVTVGYSYNTSGGVGASKAVYWPAGSSNPVELSYPDEYISGIANGINSSGVIVGLVRKSNGTTRPCIWPSPTAAPIIPPQGDAVRISETGVVLCQANSGYLTSILATEMVSLPAPPGYGNRSTQGMSHNGIIFGVAQLGGDGISRPVVWNPSMYAPQALAFIEGYQSIEVFSAGNSGTFVGRAKAQGLDFQAVYWKDATHIALLDDIVENNVNFYRGGQFVFADGSVLAYGKDPSNYPITAWLRP